MNTERNEILSIISNLTYESPDSSFFDKNVDSLTLDDERNPLTIYVKKLTERYSCSVVHRDGKMFMEPILMTVVDFSNEHTTLASENASRGLTFYFLNFTIVKVVFFDTGLREGELFIDFASNIPDLARKPGPCPMLLYEVALCLHNRGEKEKATALFYKALTAGGYISPSLALMSLPFSAQNIPLCKSNLLDCY